MAYLPIVLLLGLFYLLLIRPQQQRVKAQRALVSSLSVGDEVVTIGGLLGTILEIDDEAVLLETTPGVRLRYRRVAISGRVGPVVPDAPPDVFDVDDEPSEGDHRDRRDRRDQDDH